MLLDIAFDRAIERLRPRQRHLQIALRCVKCNIRFTIVSKLFESQERPIRPETLSMFV